MGIPLSDLLAPHYCCSCGEISAILCEYCKYDITHDSFALCLVCGGPSGPQNHLCTRCKVPYKRAWCIGTRSDGLKALIDAFKFDRVRAAYEPLADLLDKSLPHLPANIKIVPVPTIMPHKRVRGYGHMELVAKRLASVRGLEYHETLSRRHNQVQRGKDRKQRLKQAQEAFEATWPVTGVYLLIDDVYTTGATIENAAKVLKAAGASEVWVAAISRQTLEK